MDNTPLLALPLLADKQDLQTTFHDDALKTLDALTMLSVLDRDRSSPPASPNEGDRYIVKAPGSGDDAWDDDNVVVFIDGHWRAHPPQTGWTCYVQDEGALIAWDGTSWQPALDVLGGGAANNLALLGVGTTADVTNPFSAKLNNALWVARTVAEGGDGNLRYKLSKESAAKTLSLLFQDNFSGRAEIGLTGDDDFHLKVSPDGSSWIDALVLDRSTGGIGFLADETGVASAATCDIGSAAGLHVSITGTTAIASFGTQPRRLKLVHFTGALTLTHNATSLILPGGANIATAAGDAALFVSNAIGNWRCLSYQRSRQRPDQSWTLTILTASDPAWPVPAGTSEIMAEIWGGGGSGAAGDTAAGARGSGGGGGGYCFKHHKGIMDSTLNVIIGAGGAAVTSASGGANGNAGGTTSIAGTHFGTITASGGGAGAVSAGSFGAGGGFSGGDFGLTGEFGELSQKGANPQWPANGGSAPHGGMGGGPNISAAGQIPGGGGSCGNHTAGSNSGAGARGQAHIWTR